MRFWLILLQLGSYCSIISIVAFMATTLSYATGEPVSTLELLGGAWLFLAVEALLAAASGGAAAAVFGPAITTVAQPFLIIAAISFACAILSGYKRLWWLRWIGFIVNLAAGLFFFIGTLEGRYSAWPLIPTVFYLTIALLFYLVARKDDAERLRRSAALLHPALCVIGLAFSFLSARFASPSTLLLTTIFYVIFFALHYRAIKFLKLEMKPLVKTAGVLFVTLVGVFVFLFVRPVMAGPLLLGWLSVPVFAETLFLSSRRPDVPYVGWRENLRKAIKLIIVLAVLAGLLLGGLALYDRRIRSHMPSVGNLTSTEGLRAFLALNEEQASSIILIPVAEFPPTLAKVVDLSSPYVEYGSGIRAPLFTLAGISPNKALDAQLRTIIEKNLSGTEQMSLFLAIADFGRGAYGITAAAKEYYNKNLDALDICEASLLVCLSSADEAEAARTQRGLLREMNISGLISASEMKMCISDE